MLYVFGLVFWFLLLDNVRLNYAKINTKNINKGSAKQSKKKGLNYYSTIYYLNYGDCVVVLYFARTQQRRHHQVQLQHFLWRSMFHVALFGKVQRLKAFLIF